MMARLELSAEDRAALAKIDADAAAAKKAILDAHDARVAKIPLAERLVYAAAARCPCGHGMAYDPTGLVRSDKHGPFKLVSQWECAAILLGVADKSIEHHEPLPFAFWDVKSENQTSAYGRTTREPLARATK